MATLSDEARIRELAEVIRFKCAQAQQIRQQPPGTTVTSTSPAINLQPQQEVRKRLKEVVVRLHEDVRDNTLSGIQQRLQYTAGKFGLSFSVQRPSGHSLTCFMSSESFFIEVCLEETDSSISTKLVLGQEQQNSDVLNELLKKKDYPTFENHIRALVEMFNQYQGQGQEKSKVLLQVIKATEQILLKIYTSSSKQQYGPLDTILLCPFGLLTPRVAGNPMSLTFYATPLESLNCQQLESYSTGTGLPDSLGVSAKVLVERSNLPYKLPVDPNLFDVSQSSFVPLTDQNTMFVPLTLVLCLTKDIPICANIMLKLQQTVYGTDQTMPSLTTPHVNELILQESKDSGINPNKHVIYLPGQVHAYTGLNSSIDMESDHRGVLLPNRKVPFTHPSHVISIIHLLRQQLVYNTLFKSCQQRKKLDHSLPSDSSFDDYEFKVVTKPPVLIAVTTELLNSNGGITPVSFEFIIPTDRTNHPTRPKLQITIDNESKLEQSQVLNQVLARCLSIPVTIHAVFSFSAVLPPSLVAAITEHKESIRQFHLQLVARSEFEVPMIVDQAVAGSAQDSKFNSSNIAGFKRKRT